MQAIFAAKYASDTSLLEKGSLPVPKPAGSDLLVRLYAAATNPVDLIVLNNWGNAEAKTPEPGVIAGFDAAGVVEAVGPDVTFYKPGDEVYFSGVLGRHGTFAEYSLVDEKIVGKKPKSLSWAEAAAMPLCSLTAWEGLVDLLNIPVPAKDAPESKTPQSILVIGGAGGVGSIVIQLAKHALKLKVIATASRPETIEFCKSLGADVVIDHAQPLLPQLKAQGLEGVNYVYNTVNTVKYFDQIAELILPLGAVVNITPTQGAPLDIGKLFMKRVSFHFELMFARPMYQAQPERQKQSLDTVSELLDQRVIKHVLSETFPFTVQGVRDALAKQASGKAIGKIAISIRE